MTDQSLDRPLPQEWHEPSPQFQAFLKELMELSEKHGIGITNRGELFVMKKEDFGYSYRIDPNGVLYWY